MHRSVWYMVFPYISVAKSWRQQTFSTSYFNHSDGFLLEGQVHCSDLGYPHVQMIKQALHLWQGEHTWLHPGYLNVFVHLVDGALNQMEGQCPHEEELDPIESQLGAFANHLQRDPPLLSRQAAKPKGSSIHSRTASWTHYKNMRVHCAVGAGLFDQAIVVGDQSTARWICRHILRFVLPRGCSNAFAHRFGSMYPCHSLLQVCGCN